jgi:predicted type IV restriction endonuclease
MREDLIDIQDRLKAGRFPNEASVSQGIVQRLLHSLGWPVYDTGVVSPEYSLEGRRVDYALCHPASKPLVLIEVKQVGQSEGADRQLFEYAFHGGVPMAILTDGREWSFFLPTEQGRYDERRLYKLDLLERNSEEIEATLNRYLGYEDICSGRAIEAARRDYRNAARKREAEKALPEAWKKLIEAEDELLMDLVSEKVEDLCGVKPDVTAVATFLRRRLHSTENKPPHPFPAPKKRNPERSLDTSYENSQTPEFVGFSLHGKTHRYKNAIETYTNALRELARRDPDFPTRFAAYPKGRGKRPYIARTREALYPGKPDFEGGRELRRGWWIDTNLSNKQKARLMKIACDVMDIKYGTDLKVNFG